MRVRRRLGSEEVTSSGRALSGLVDVVAQRTPLFSFADHAGELWLFGTIRR